MKVLIACEHSGVVREAFAARGFDAWSCDLLPSDQPGQHHQGCILEAFAEGGRFHGWDFDLMIAHPDCTYLCSSGLHWNRRRPERAQKTEGALQFVQALWNLPVPRKALENPQGCINTRLPTMPRPQYIQPHQFGHDASKKTGLWLDGLPHLVPTQNVDPRWVDGRPRWANQTDSGQNRLGPSEDRWKERARTYEGIAEAMAQQWGDYAADPARLSD